MIEAVGTFVTVGAVVDVGAGELVGMEVDDAVGKLVDEGVNVAGTGADVFVAVFVDVGKFGMMVTPGTGVSVGIFGTQSFCPV